MDGSDPVDDRPGVTELLGQPLGFKVTFEEVEGVVVRFESWIYPELRTRVDFIDGEALWTIELEPVPDDTFFPGWYDPLAFSAAMPRDAAVALVTAASPARMGPEAIPLDDAGPEFAGATMLVVIRSSSGSLMINLSTSRRCRWRRGRHHEPQRCPSRDGLLLAGGLVVPSPLVETTPSAAGVPLPLGANEVVSLLNFFGSVNKRCADANDRYFRAGCRGGWIRSRKRCDFDRAPGSHADKPAGRHQCRGTRSRGDRELVVDVVGHIAEPLRTDRSGSGRRDNLGRDHRAVGPVRGAVRTLLGATRVRRGQPRS